MRFILQLAAMPTQVPCQARGCGDLPTRLMYSINQRTISLIGPGAVWLCDDHRRIEQVGSAMVVRERP